MAYMIGVQVLGKIARQTDQTLYICGNSDYVVAFDFDEEWNAYDTKTARFSYNGTYQDVVFQGNVCPVPIISNAYNIKCGVYAGDLRTTTPAHISAKKSILCDGGMPADPPPDVYAQIMARLNELTGDEAAQLAKEAAQLAQEASERAEEAVKRAEEIADMFTPYQGEYVVIPSADAATVLQTAQTVLSEDVEVAQIPYSEVTNTTDGVTVTIA